MKKTELTLNDIGETVSSLGESMDGLTQTVDSLAQMMMRGFDETNARLDILSREVSRNGDDIRDFKNTVKSHQQMLVDHDKRIDHLEFKTA